MSNFRALVLSQGPDRKVSGAVETLDEDRLPAGDVTVAVEYSTLNYKDGLAVTGQPGIMRKFPMVPGIDGTRKNHTMMMPCNENRRL